MLFVVYTIMYICSASAQFKDIMQSLWYHHGSLSSMGSQIKDMVLIFVFQGIIILYHPTTSVFSEVILILEMSESLSILIVGSGVATLICDNVII